MQSISDIALLFFARSPYSDTKRKEFGSDKLHLEVVSHLHFKTYRKLCNTGLPVIVSNEHTQKSHSLATNLSQAISEVFQKGYQKVIVVGNDCPNLNKTTLESAIQSLHEGKNVLGPDMEGGTYLIGIHQSEFSKGAFEKALMVKSEVQSKLSEFLQSFGNSPVILEPKHDINSRKALCKYVRVSLDYSPTYTFLRRIYFSLIHFVKENSHYIQRYYASIFSSDSSRRGPPICIYKTIVSLKLYRDIWMRVL